MEDDVLEQLLTEPRPGDLAVPAPADVPVPPAAPVSPAVAREPSGEPVDVVPGEPVDPDDAVAAGTATPPSGLWERMKADPQYAPEHLALEAVRRLGPEARAWAERTRAWYPQLSADELARLAIRRFVTRARLSGAISGAAGLPGAVLDVGVLAWTQARLVLHVAAAYGHDPEHPDRATDLLVLQKVHKAAETARLALGVAAGRERLGALLRRTNTPLGRVLLRLGVKLAQMAGIRAAKRLFAKAVPGAAILLGTWANSAATKKLARRAQDWYRPPAIGGPPSGGPVS